MEENYTIIPVNPDTFEYQEYSQVDENIIPSQSIDTGFELDTDFIEFYIYNDNQQLEYPLTDDVSFTGYSVREGDILLDPARDLLNEGYYGGKQYFSPETVKLFTQRHEYSTRRGIGFDMFELNPNRNPNFSKKASRNTFGHLGFTGTCTWADPDNNLIYVFLSNRTYPTMKNRKLYSGDFRPRIQDLIYEALMD